MFRLRGIVLGLARRAWPEAALYAVVAGALTLLVACLFYGSMRLQTSLTADPNALRFAGEWSAPLDDVFIHFDFARATARGYPFQWSETNGYSSGGTSLLYPFVLAVGYAAGFRGMSLMIWAAVVAAVSVFALLLACRRMFVGLPRWTSYLAPPALLGLGVLSWTLFSGMEVAVFLGLFGGALLAWDDLWRSSERSWLGVPPAALWLGFWGALLVATRPEAAIVVAVLALSGAARELRRSGRTRALAVLSCAALPGALVVLAQAVANRLITGDFTAAGALVKLELHHPYLTSEQKWHAWLFHISYQVLRVTHYHMSLVPGFGWIIWTFAAAALLFDTTRRFAALLWACAAVWILTVALNGQVRWQNERYTMPAVAWLLMAASLGCAVLLSGSFALAHEKRAARLAGLAYCVLGLSLFVWQQAPRYREQVWFFGRASRNIRDQHVRAGRYLARMNPAPRRILVGDAGALSYASDLPALDIIGLGGYRDLPFARASRLGVEAALELIERIPKRERPDLLAIYPAWWGSFPLWFGHKLAEFPVSGNVICGGPSKVIYAANWAPFDGSAQPSTLSSQTRIVDELDVADVVSEREHQFSLDAPGYVQMKLLEKPGATAPEVWDAGRLAPAGLPLRFDVQGLVPGKHTRLVLRTAPVQRGRIAVSVDDEPLGVIELDPSDRWTEPSLALKNLRGPNVRVTLTALGDEYVLYHVWMVQER